MSDNNKHRFEPNNKYFTIVVYGLLFVLGALLLYMIIGHFGKTLDLIGKFLSLISPFLVGFFIAFLLYPLVHILYHKFFTGLLKIKSTKLAKWLSIVLAYIIAISVITIVLVFVAPQVYASISELTVQFPIWYDNVMNFIRNFETTHPEISKYIDIDELNNYIQSALPSIIDKATGIATSLLPKIFTTSISIVKGVFSFLIALMSSIYMLADHKNIFYYGKRLLYAILPKKHGDKALELFSQCHKIFSGFIYGKALDSLIIGIICFICMTIFKFPYAILISVAVGVTNMIPIFGPYLGGAVGFVIIVIIDPIQALFFALLILAIQQFDGLYLGPHILGDSVGLNPLWVIVAITVGGSLFGIIGMFLGVPCVAVIAHILHLTIEHFLHKKNVTVKRAEDENIM